MKQPLEQSVPLHSENGPVHLQISVPSSDLNKYLHFPWETLIYALLIFLSGFSCQILDLGKVKAYYTC